MRRNSLLATGMLLALLATSACSATDPNPANTPSAGSTVGSIDSDLAAEVGASQLAAAEKAKAVASQKAEDEAAQKAKAEAVKKAEDEAAAVQAAEAAAGEKAQAAPAAPLDAAKALASTGGGTAVVPPAPAKSPAPAPVQAASASEQVINTTYTTAYTWYDNTPAGSATISHPVLHKTAGGTGTYDDPITIAVGHSLATGQDVLDFPAGTRIYLPNVRRYFIVEDTCGDGASPQNGGCHQGTNVDGTNSTIWIDMWIGGQSTSSAGADSCAGKVTGVQTAVFNPAGNYAVAPGAGVIHDGKCDAGYGNELVRQ